MLKIKLSDRIVINRDLTMQFIFKRLLSTSGEWMKRHVNDPYVKKSKAENLRSRSAFKLKEIDDKYKLIRKDDCVLDLGAAPGLLTD
jgi:predicted rRNA methylase YqxC with S4 and FtsJ domains